MVTLAEHLVDQLLEVENPSICSQCKGACCKGYPGVTSPEDWGAPDKDEMRRRLAQAFDTGKWRVDEWYGDPRTPNSDGDMHVYFVRPEINYSIRNYRKGLYDPCTFLGDKGCELSYGQRPRECRTLKPGPGMLDGDRDDHCKNDDYSKRQAAIEWMPYQDVLLPS